VWLRARAIANECKITQRVLVVVVVVVAACLLSHASHTNADAVRHVEMIVVSAVSP